MPTPGQLYARAAERQQQAMQGLTGRPFSAIVKSVQPTTENMEVIHAYGKHTLRVIHPYVGSNSWHRVGAEAGRHVLMHVRMDTKEPSASSYLAAEGRDNLPERRIAAYEKGKDLYRPLALGEHEIHSSGVAQVYAARRGVLDVRGGYVRGWFDQDAMEAGVRSVTHVRELHLQKVAEVGDEERFGGVTRPDPQSKVFRKIVEAPPGLAVPNPEVNVSAASDDPVAAAEAAAASAIPAIEPAKEWMFVLKTASGPVIDHREGHVTDDAGEAIDGKLGGKLRYRKKIYGSLSSAGSGAAAGVASAGAGTETWEEQVDDNGNWYVGLPQTATEGIKFEVPMGKFNVKSGTASSEMTFDGTAGSILMKATTEATLRGESGLKLHSAQVKIGQTDAAVNKVYATMTKKAAQSTLHGGLGGTHSADGISHTLDASLNAALAVINAVAMACPLTPGVVVGLLGMAHSIIPVVLRAAGAAMKVAKGGLSGAYVGSQDTHESNTVSISS